MKLKAVLFDMDGTLVISHPCHALAYRLLSKELGIKISGKKIEEYMKTPSEISFHQFAKDFHTKQSPEWLVNKKRKIIKQCSIGKNYFAPNAWRIIQELKQKGLRLGIVSSSGRKSLNIFLPKDFQKNFDAIICLEDVKHIKPSSEPMKKALKKLKLKPSQVIMVGDSTSDLIAARKTKIKAIGITTGLSSKKELLKEKPIAVIKNLNQIKKFLQ
ncbi:MAG: HAD family hydrolase [archaeon]|nr:HAD family hydrolase [archaeon]